MCSGMRCDNKQKQYVCMSLLTQQQCHLGQGRELTASAAAAVVCAGVQIYNIDYTAVAENKPIHQHCCV
jgi:hypothetical protein